MGVIDEVDSRVPRRCGDLRFGEELCRLPLGLVACPRLDCRPDDILEVVDPAPLIVQTLVVEPLQVADELRQPLELVTPDHRHHEPAVARLERGCQEWDTQLLVRIPDDAERPEVRDQIADRDHRVEHRDVDVLPAAHDVAVSKRARIPISAKSPVPVSPTPPSGFMTGSWCGRREYS